MSSFTPHQVLRRQLTIYPIFAVGGIVAVWAYWAYQAYLKTPDPKAAGIASATIWLVIAAIATVAVPIWLTVKLMQTRLLLQRGRLTTARLGRIDGAVSNGRQSTTFTYAVDGQEYACKASVEVNRLNAFGCDTTVPVIYDPQKPSRAQAFPHLAGVTVEEPSAVREVVGETVDFVVYGALLIGQAVGLMALVVWLAKPYATAMLGPAVFGAITLTMLEARVFERLRGVSGPGHEANLKWRDRWMVLLAVVTLAWGGLAFKYGGGAELSEQVIADRDAQSAQERAERARIERESRAAIEQLQKIREQQQKK